MTTHEQDLLLSHGYSSDTHKIVYHDTPPTPAQPTISSGAMVSPTGEQQKMGALKAASLGARKSIVPTAAGLVGGIAAPAIVGSVAGPLGTLAGLGVGIAGVVGGSMAGSALQESAPGLVPWLPANEEMATAQTEQPLATAVGELVPLAATLRPSLTPLKVATQGLRTARLASTEHGLLPALSLMAPMEKEALANVGTGLALSSAPIVYDLAVGNEVDPKLAALHILSGATLTQPWGAGKMLGMTPITTDRMMDVIPQNPAGLKPKSKSAKEIAAAKAAAQPEQTFAPAEAATSEQILGRSEPQFSVETPKEENLDHFSPQELDLAKTVSQKGYGDAPYIAPKSWYEGWNKFTEMYRGARTKNSKELSTAGQMEFKHPSEGLSDITINPEKEFAGTRAHEGMHAYFKQLSISENPIDAGLIEKWVKQTNANEAYNKWANAYRAKYNLEPSPEEFLAREVSSYMAKRRLFGEANDAYYKADLASTKRVREGNATNEDFYSVFANRYLQSAPFGAMQFKGAVKPVTLTGPSTDTEGKEIPRTEEVFVPEASIEPEQKFPTISKETAADISNKIEQDKAKEAAKEEIELRDRIANWKFKTDEESWKEVNRGIEESESGKKYAEARSKMFSAEPTKTDVFPFAKNKAEGISPAKTAQAVKDAEQQFLKTKEEYAKGKENVSDISAAFDDLLVKANTLRDLPENQSLTGSELSVEAPPVVERWSKERADNNDTVKRARELYAHGQRTMELLLASENKAAPIQQKLWDDYNATGYKFRGIIRNALLGGRVLPEDYDLPLKWPSINKDLGQHRDKFRPAVEQPQQPTSDLVLRPYATIQNDTAKQIALEEQRYREAALENLASKFSPKSLYDEAVRRINAGETDETVHYIKNALESRKNETSPAKPSVVQEQAKSAEKPVAKEAPKSDLVERPYNKEKKVKDEVQNKIDELSKLSEEEKLQLILKNLHEELDLYDPKASTRSNEGKSRIAIQKQIDHARKVKGKGYEEWLLNNAEQDYFTYKTGIEYNERGDAVKDTGYAKQNIVDGVINSGVVERPYNKKQAPSEIDELRLKVAQLAKGTIDKLPADDIIFDNLDDTAPDLDDLLLNNFSQFRNKETGESFYMRKEGVDYGKVLRGEVEHSVEAPPEFKKKQSFSSKTLEWLLKQPPHKEASVDETVRFLSKGLPKAEIDVLNSAFESSLGERMSYGKMYDLLEQKTPDAHIISYGAEGKVSEAAKELGRMQHEWLEKLEGEEKRIVDSYIRHIRGIGYDEYSAQIDKLSKVTHDNLMKYTELRYKASNEYNNDTTLRMTGRQVGAYGDEGANVAPKSTKTHPVTRVDVVVPQKEVKYKHGETDMEKHDPYQKGIVKERPLWQPDSLHEQFPNTLGWAAIQYETLPNGEKVAHLFEVQSSWAQQKRKYWNTYEATKKEMEQQGRATPEQIEYHAKAEAENSVNRYRPGMDHPLDKDTNRLALKAAIEEARKNGATKIAISDAETAMMTEGHDLQTYYQIEPTAGNKRLAEKHYGSDKYEQWTDDVINGRGALLTQTEANRAKAQGYVISDRQAPSQEPGMRFNYDPSVQIVDKNGNVLAPERFSDEESAHAFAQSRHGLNLKKPSTYPKGWNGPRDEPAYQLVKGQLHQIAEELTGSKGERVSFGEHKNAFKERYAAPGEITAAEEILKSPIEKVQRPDLIFKNPNGTFKTDNSAVMYDIRNVSKEPWTLYSKEHSQEAPMARGDYEDISTEPLSQRDETLTEPKTGSRFSFSRSMIDSMKAIGTPEHHYLANKLEKVYTDAQKFFGRFGNSTLKELQKLTPAEQAHLDSVAMEMRRTHTDLTDQLNAKERAVYDKIRSLLVAKQEEQIEANEGVIDFYKDGRPFVRLPKVDEFYWPSLPRPSVINEVLNNPTSEKAKKLKQDFIDYQIAMRPEMDEAGATDLFNRWKNYFNPSKKKTSTSTHFAADRMAEGVGLPDSWREKNVEVSMSRYWKKVSKDRAFHDVIETDDDAALLIGLEKSMWGDKYSPTKFNGEALTDKETKSIYEDLTGENVPEEHVANALSSVATRLFLGPLTNIHIALSTPFSYAKYLPPGKTPGYVAHLISNTSKGVTKSLERGYRQLSPNKRANYLNRDATVAERLQALGEDISKLTGREATEKWSKALSSVAADYVVNLHDLAAQTGNKKSLEFLQTLDNSYKPGEANLDDLATRLSALEHGAFDPRTMPKWMLNEGFVAPFFKLNSWNMGQMNNFNKFVLPRLKKGDPEPFLMSLFGGVLGGTIIKSLREELSDREAPHPSMKELTKNWSQLPDANLTAYNTIAAASYAGVAGMWSVGAKAIYDIVYKNRPQGAAFPLDELLSDSLKTVNHVTQALAAGENPIEVAPRAVADFAKANVQAYRVVLNNLVKTGLINEVAPESFAQTETRAAELSKGSRDLRAWKMASGELYQGQDLTESNPYMRIPEKIFKSAPIEDAMQMLPSLIQRAWDRANGNFEVFKHQLQALRINQYPTMPDPETMPGTFFRYAKDLEETKGKEEASKIISNYFRKHMENKMKASMVP